MILLIELTVPAEENILAAQIRKTARYEQLAFLAKLINSWDSKIITIEVGARGFVAKSMNSFLRSVDFSNNEASSTRKDISMIVARCSHNIFLQQKRNFFGKKDLC